MTERRAPEPYPIMLDQVEMIFAAVTGAMRHHSVITHGRKAAYPGSESESLAHHLNGAAGEQAVAKAKGRYWGGHVDRFKGADIGKMVQVRTRSQPGNDLPVFENANDDEIYVLVTGTAPNFEIRGWIWARDAKNPAWLKSADDNQGIGVYWVPQWALNSMTKAPKHQEEPA